MDDALYRLHAEREETYWWWVAKNRIILSLVERYFWAERESGIGSRESQRPVSNSRPAALDIGCGAGGVLARLAERFDAVGIDMSPIARDYCLKRGLKAMDGALPDALPVKEPDCFDVIVLSEVIEHVQKDRASIQTVAALLKPGGILICTVPAHMWLWSSHDVYNHHQRRYTRRGFGELFSGLPLQPLVLSYYQAASMPFVAGARALDRLRASLSGTPPGSGEASVKPLPGPINWALTKAFEVEKDLLPRTRLPWGTSVISVHRKRT